MMCYTFKVYDLNFSMDDEGFSPKSHDNTLRLSLQPESSDFMTSNREIKYSGENSENYQKDCESEGIPSIFRFSNLEKNKNKNGIIFQIERNLYI